LAGRCGRSAFARFASFGETDFACQELAVTWGGDAALDEARPKASEVWLGGRDSNPDKQSQSLLSYRWTTSQQDESEKV
jgi:hypothetical protein